MRFEAPRSPAKLLSWLLGPWSLPRAAPGMSAVCFFGNSFQEHTCSPSLSSLLLSFKSSFNILREKGESETSFSKYFNYPQSILPNFSMALFILRGWGHQTPLTHGRGKNGELSHSSDKNEDSGTLAPEPILLNLERKSDTTYWCGRR